MKTLGIIAEYNPLHTGHAYHIQNSCEITGADAVVAVMSGSFVQRGEAAVMNKWARARAALLCGVDLVIELPFCFAAQSAEYFAKGAVQLLSSLNVDYLSFGSEAGEIAPLEAVANALAFENKLLSQDIKTALDEGISYPAARRKGMGALGAVLDEPNNILGVEYLKAIKRCGSGLKSITVKRIGAGYSDVAASDGYASATGIRRELFSLYNSFEGRVMNPPLQNTDEFDGLQKYLPTPCYEILMKEIAAGRAPLNNSFLDAYITAALRVAGADGIKNAAYCGEGLENRIARAAMQNYGFDAIAQGVKTKRYPLTRLQRLLINFAVGLDNEQLQRFVASSPQYIRVLGTNAVGRKLLAASRKTAELPIITKTADYKKHGGGLLKAMRELEFKATDLYVLGYGNMGEGVGGADLTTSPILIK